MAPTTHAPVWEPLPPDEAIRFFRSKGIRISGDPAEVSAEEHARAFTVSRMAQLDLLEAVQTAIDEALANGTTLAAFKRQLTPLLQRAGWWGSVTEPDGQGGERTVQLGSPWRLRTIYETNLRTAYATGRWEQIEQTKGTHPYLRYVGSVAQHRRPEHVQWAGLVLPVDDPWWNTHYPPNGWGCLCSTQQLSRAALDRTGDRVGAAPPVVMKPYQNPKTGETRFAPHGVDPSFAFNAGKERTEVAARQLLDKVTAAPPALGAATWAQAKEVNAPLVQRAFARWSEQVATGAAAPNGSLWTVGAVSPHLVEVMAEAGHTLASAGITVTDRAILHILADGKAVRGAGITLAELQRLPQILAAPAAVLEDVRDGALLYVFDGGAQEARRGKFVVRVNYREKALIAGQRGVLVSNAVRTAGWVPRNVLATPSQYRVVEGTL